MPCEDGLYLILCHERTPIKALLSLSSFSHSFFFLLTSWPSGPPCTLPACFFINYINYVHFLRTWQYYWQRGTLSFPYGNPTLHIADTSQLCLYFLLLYMIQIEDCQRSLFFPLSRPKIMLNSCNYLWTCELDRVQDLPNGTSVPRLIY